MFKKLSPQYIHNKDFANLTYHIIKNEVADPEKEVGCVTENS